MIRAYATTFDEHGDALLENAPLTEPPGRIESDEESLVVSSVELGAGVWKHTYRDRSSGTLHYMTVRPA